MSVYRPQNSRIFWYDFQHKGRRFYGSTGQTLRRAAEKVEAERRADALSGRQGKPVITLDDAAALYEDRLRANNQWTADYERWILRIVTAFGPATYLNEVQQSDVSRHFRGRAGIVAGSTVNRELDVAKALWRATMKAGYEIGDMPDFNGLRYAVREHDPRELSDGEEARLVAAIRSDLLPLVEFAILSGWRVSEIRQLRWSDLDLPAGHAWAVIKGGIKVQRQLSTQMVALVANQTKAGPFVFTYICQKTRLKRVKGERYPLSRDGWRKEWYKALKAAGIEEARFHDLRHTFGTRMLRETGNLVVTQAAMRHQNIKTTQRYAKATPKDVRAALEALHSRNSPKVEEANEEKSRNSAA